MSRGCLERDDIEDAVAAVGAADVCAPAVLPHVEQQQARLRPLHPRPHRPLYSTLTQQASKQIHPQLMETLKQQASRNPGSYLRAALCEMYNRCSKQTRNIFVFDLAGIEVVSMQLLEI